MRRSILLALVAALALAVGLSSVAVAGHDGAAVSAKKANKKAKKKGKGCKAKGKGNRKGKRKGKARASAKKKGKKRGCKGGAKNASGWPLRPGEYEGQDGVGLKVTAGGKKAALIYNGFESARATCFPIAVILPEEPATSTAKLFKAGGSTNNLFGGSGEAKWSIEVTSQLRYKLTLDSSHHFPEQDPCNAPGVVFRGTLKKSE